jgi:hypothetical protein
MTLRVGTGRIHRYLKTLATTTALTPVYTADFTTGTLPSGVSVSSPSLGGLITDSTGKLTYKPNNLLLNSATLSTQSVTTIVGVRYIVAFYGTGSITLSGAATGTITGTGAGVQVYSKVTATTTTLTLTVSGSVTSATCSAVTYETTPRSGDQVITTSSAYYGPAFDYSATSVGTPLGLRIWESRTNLIYPSTPNLNATAWSINNLGQTLNAAVAPDGTTTATKVVAQSTGTIFASYPNLITPTSATITGSIYAKPAGYNYAYVYVAADDGGTKRFGAVFNLTTGAVTQTTIAGGVSGVASAVAVGNGWFRLSLSIISGGATGGLSTTVIGVSSTATLGSYNASFLYSTTPGNGTDGVYFWGAQEEQGVSFAGPLIPTGSASVTAAADAVTLTGTALTTLQGSAGGAIVDLTPAVVASGRGILSESSSTTAPLLMGTSSVLGTRNSTTELDTSSALVVSTRTRAGVTWSASGRSVSLGGGTVATDANAFGTITGATLGARNGSTNFTSGWYATLAEYNQLLTSAQLQARTTVGASY